MEPTATINLTKDDIFELQMALSREIASARMIRDTLVDLPESSEETIAHFAERLDRLLWVNGTLNEALAQFD